MAPPVIRAPAAPLRQRKAPAVALLVVGALLIVGPIVGGFFAKVAAGKQLVDEFAPHLEADALARYEGDLGILRRGAAAIDAVYAQQSVPAEKFIGISHYREQAAEIDQRATALLNRVAEAEPDYRRVADIGGFDRVPFLFVVAGLAAVFAGVVLLGGDRSRSLSAAAIGVLAAAALLLYPFVSDLPSGTRAGQRMLGELAPVMTSGAVRQLQTDFVAIVHAVGELDTGFRAVPQGTAGADINALVDGWPRVSSDLAALVGALNDNIDNFSDLDDLDALTGGLDNMPWMLVGLGVFLAACSIAALPRRAKETT